MGVDVEIRLDPACAEPKLVLFAAALTPELETLVRQLTDTRPGRIVGFHEQDAVLLRPEEILRVFAEQQKVFAQTDRARFALRMRLYEAEARLAPAGFVRISGSELINLARARRLDMSFTGTILIELDGGVTAYVSRRYVAAIKKTLGI